MMQQQLYQDQQSGTQDASGHQMVLCPVRVVYETQMLVQPGEQIQPNQTIFINPQNTPPWIQNRAVQNQVIYVQNVPTNYVQPTQQHIDPNQLYIQNYGYQNIQQMLVQNQEQIRPMQMMAPNVGQAHALGQNVQTQRLISNVASMPNTINIVNAQNQNVPMNRQIAHNQIANINELVNNVKQENVGQNIYRQVSQPMQQDPRAQMQQTVTIVPSNMQRPIYEQNVGQMQTISQQNLTNIQTAYQNAMINVQDTRKISMPLNKTNNYTIVNPNTSVKGPQVFRPIQPRTNNIRSNAPQFPPVQPAANSMPTPNIVNVNVPRKISNNTVQMSNVGISSNGKIEGHSIVINRKRKSESPDEIHKRVAMNNQVENPIIIKRLENVNPVICSDVGVNTSPIHKPDGRITINNLQITPLNQTNPNANSKLKEELAKKPVNYAIKEPQNVIRNVSSPIPSSAPSDKDKLIRNTVYTQARGRVLNDKEKIIEPPKIEILANDIVSPAAKPTVEIQNETSTATVEVDKNEEVKKLEEPKPTNNTVSPVVIENKQEVKKDEIKSNPKEPTEEIKFKKDRDFILTHVLDGYVIQESNTAFPIRKPLKEKTILSNSEEGETKNEQKETKREKNTEVKNNSKILNISHLQIKDIECMNYNENDSEKVSDGPFKTLQTSTVKTWTVDQLAAHLTKFGWTDTVSVLQEHEIDGESILLVSKGQLITIGVKEEHAEIISDFVKS